jgi:hypothetical protein
LQFKTVYNNIKKIGVIAVPLVLLLLPSTFFDHGQTVCLSVFLLDMECYGCGITRAIMHLIHGDIQTALYYNKLSVIVLPVLIYGWFDIFQQEFNIRLIPLLKSKFSK